MDYTDYTDPDANLEGNNRYDTRPETEDRFENGIAEYCDYCGEYDMVVVVIHPNLRNRQACRDCFDRPAGGPGSEPKGR